MNRVPDVNSGHYTSFARHFRTEQWHYFNDEQVHDWAPVHNDSRAYILFYERPRE